jgi:hypothetical protein
MSPSASWNVVDSNVASSKIPIAPAAPAVIAVRVRPGADCAQWMDGVVGGRPGQGKRLALQLLLRDVS